MPESSLFTSFSLNDLTFKNRLIKSATYEGMAVDNTVSQRLIDWHVEIINGGTSLTTLAYCAVSESGATFPEQIILSEYAAAGLTRFNEAIHSVGGMTSVQLAHCGFFSKNTALSSRPMSPSRTFNKLGAFSGLPFSERMSVDDIDRTTEEFANAALKAQQYGFDAIELHSGHGYLLSQFLSPAFNKRKDDYGGKLENRLRFPVGVVKAVKEYVGKRFPLLIKMNLNDGFNGGLTLDESCEVALAFQEAGADALVLSGGFTSVTPFYLLRGDIPYKRMIEVEKNWMQRIGVRLFGKMIIKEIPFTEAFFLDQAKKVREAVDLPLVYIGGARSLSMMEQLIVEGFDLIALGRPLIHDAQFTNKLKSGEVQRSGCTQCNQCIPEVDRGGVRCVI